MSVTAKGAFEGGSDRDRQFFESHPSRNYRVRAALEGEFPELTAPGGAWLMIAVRQLAPGVRARIPFVTNQYAPTGEAEARDLYSALTAGSCAAKRVEAM